MSYSFGFTMPGQPPTWNHMYTVRNVRLQDGRTVKGKAKTPEVQLYQSQLTMICRAAKPSDFAPDELSPIIVAHRMHLKRNLDADNVMKVIHDAMAVALGVNDSRFWPVVIEKESGFKNPEVQITVYDGGRYRVAVLGQ